MKTDFEHAIEYHCKAYPGFEKWLTGNAEQLKFIRKVIGHFDRGQLQEATDAMYAAEEQPHGYSNHARELKRLVNNAYYGGTATAPTGPSVMDGQLVSNCWRCQDYGIISVVSPSTLKRIRAGDESGAVNTCVLVCDCSAGSGKKGTRWAAGHCLIEYMQLLNAACERAKEFGDLTVALWNIAREQVLSRDEELRPQAESLDGAILP